MARLSSTAQKSFLTFLSLYRLDPGGPHDWIYNRYANIGCELPRHGYQISAGLVYPDLYIWFFAPDLPILQKAGYRYALFPSAWPGAASYGFSLCEKIEPGNLWVYRYTRSLISTSNYVSSTAEDGLF